MNLARYKRWITGLVPVLLVFGVSTAAASQGVVNGRLADAASGQPVAEARVLVVGSNVFAVSNAEGRYTLRNVAAGAQQVRVLRVGYLEQKKSVTVSASSPATLDFSLTAAVIKLQEVVTTATGEQRKLEVGNSIANIDAAKLTENTALRNVTDALTGRTPGVQTLSVGATGSGGRIRIRGTSSLSLSNDPIYIVDGVRVESSTSSSSIGLGGTLPSRVNDLNPEEFESIEIVKGPSAATLYGSDAANGVIVITTKRGRAGPARWSTHYESGLIKNTRAFPASYAGWGKQLVAAPGLPVGTIIRNCTLSQAMTGICAQDSVSTFNALTNDETTIFGNGNRQQVGLQLSGGSDAVKFFSSGEYEEEIGAMKLPEFEVNRLTAANAPMPAYIRRPNAQKKASVRANITSAVSRNLDLKISTGYVSSKLRTPNLDNNLLSPVAQGLFSVGYRNNGNNSDGYPLNGYASFVPGEIFQESYGQMINRFIGSSTLDYRPLSWLSGRLNVGADFTSRVDDDLCRFGECPNNGSNRLGFKLNNRSEFFQYTVDGSTAANYQLLPWIGTKTTVGVQYFANRFARNGATGRELTPGGTTVSQGAVKVASESTDEVRTMGYFVEEAVAIRDRLFITGALRADNNSTFGSNFKGVVYPKTSVSYVISDESFFPKPSWLTSVRLRSALGESGVRPGTIDALQYFTTSLVRLSSAEQSGLVLSAPGNVNLKPETIREFEGGIDAGLLDNRINVELTYYTKTSRDALINRVLAPSLGAGVTSRFENLGKVRNAGAEALVSAQVMDRPTFGWDVTLTGSSNSNKVVDLGGVPPIVGTTTRQQAGYPLNGYWLRQITSFADRDNNGIITQDEVTVDDSTSFIGHSIPRYTSVFTNGFELFNKRIRLQTLVDYSGGNKLYNNTERFKCRDASNCAAIYDKNTPLDEQARAVAMRDHPTRTLAGYFEDASFVRLREVSLTFTAPEAFAQRYLRAQRLSATFSGRNLAIKTKYKGLDPESTASQGDLPDDFLTLPPPSYYTLRFNIGF